MELVDGVPVDRYCDEQRLTITQRLDVFVRICRGVQYAHRNLVVHRDLKPDNILVLADGSPKLLDFGVAKLLAGARADRRRRRRVAASTWALTPDFASPEQVSGGLVTTASDVYALGVLLHLLLTGLPPYRLGHDTRPTMAATLSGLRIAAPSERGPGDGDGAARASRPGADARGAGATSRAAISTPSSCTRSRPTLPIGTRPSMNCCTTCSATARSVPCMRVHERRCTSRAASSGAIVWAWRPASRRSRWVRPASARSCGSRRLRARPAPAPNDASTTCAP